MTSGDHTQSSRILLVGTSDWVRDLGETLETTVGAVRCVDTESEALDAVRRDTPDCVLTEYALGGRTGIDLLRQVRASNGTMPVVIAAATGSESIASDAIEAGVDDYVVLDQPVDAQFDRIVDRVEGVVDAAQRRASRRERAHQFDAVFADTQTATWVLDPEGALVRGNRTASEMAGGNAAPFEGDPFWTLPLWSGEASTQTDVRQLVNTAVDGSFAHAVITLSLDASNPRVVDLSVRPVEDERGDLVSIVVDGVDITDRVELERDLRRSEALHRVTLNNMTDTVLITNEAGEYTYVCPNVHFIFGYSADEIRDRYPIEELLGADLFDRDRLAADGVLKNIECTVTDKAGREHTLLVNVREVSIQDGTILYSCRDITKRKQREESLAALHETAREFLYAETHGEIAQHIVDDTESVLDIGASAVYLFDSDANALRPTAHSPGMVEVHGPLPTRPLDGESLPSHSFVEGETVFFGDVHDSTLLDNPATDLRSAAYIPLGDHGVFVAGSDEVGVFDTVTRELADLLAATTEAALDRVRRESQLREQDRELKRSNEQLTTLNRINETIREIDRTIVRAETREEIDRAVCDRLTEEDRFQFAWIGSVDSSTETVEPRAWAGDEQGYLDSQPFSVASSGTEPAGRTAATGAVTIEPTVATDLRDEPWRTDALMRDFTSVLSIPLAYNDLTHGILTVYADSPDAFDETARTVLAELGETIASALSAIERKNALLTTTVTRVTFDVDDPTFVLSRLAREADCSVGYQGDIRQTSEGSALFLTVDGAPVDAVVAVASEMAAIDEIRPISEDESGGVVRLLLQRPFLAQELAEHGAVLREANAVPTDSELVIDIPDSITTRAIRDVLRGTLSNVELRTKQTLDRTNERLVGASLLEDLTTRQLEVVQTAFYSGFFESPRESNGQDVADLLGISPPAFYRHVRTTQRKLFAAVFEERSLLESGERFNN